MLEFFLLAVLVAALFAFFGAARLLFAILLLPLKLAFWLPGWLFLAIVCLPLAVVGFAIFLAIGLPLLVIGMAFGGICLVLAAIWAMGSLLFG
ncbi:MAG: hypothetical protein ACRDGR_01500 [bacterium]